MSSSSTDTPFDYTGVAPLPDGGSLRLYGCLHAAPATCSTLLLLLHGANHCSASFSLLCAALRGSVQLLCYDARGHGDSRCTGPFDARTLALDAVAVARHASTLLPRDAGVVLVGHSMGAAIACHAVQVWPCDVLKLQGLVMMDFVEGTALASLPAMADVVAAMPMQFTSRDSAVEWALTSTMLRLRASAVLSIPPALRDLPAGVEWAARAFMTESEPHWRGWFTGTNDRFLAFPGPRLLLLADDLDRLDDALLTAQMQGKFMLRIVAGAGHVVHEDAPDRVAEAIRTFLARSGITAHADATLLEAKLQRARAAAAGVVTSGADGAVSGVR